ncbi:unnamed protein product [Penicillium salamii]|uniref:Probable E3 ubiquitin ligase complex SCF subunit sconB n=1 Tax=Penicillium salamii TaxID=1612424 RepID=A0A9W4JTL2_9EURO|nr:unnamed protein product [Penicillium salamii]CAG8295623.1 unnamed protein product [Penicillium salamii]CAG8368952.1 unnamed protein product [Penicillium salamii]CAG8381183.1 unnamed protein product [Penicillium salamii]CAG8383190.1 unnamed protein product [Penicillium salamii]
MPKRRRDDEPNLPPKRIRNDGKSTDRLSSLSNELLLHILSFLPVSSLNVCQRLSRRFQTLGGDSELWKRQYYSQWVQPRARRLANSRRTTLPTKVDYSPRVATWFDHGHLAHEGNWKRQYRLRHNWSRGLCRVTEVEFPEPPCPPTLVRFCAGIVFTVESARGLRAWTATDPARCLASISLSSPDSPVTPTALAVSHAHGKVEISAGMGNGHISLFLLDLQTSKLELQSSYSAGNGTITAMALSTSYLLVVSQYKNLILYKLHYDSHQAGGSSGAAVPRQLASLKADNIVAPMTLSLRVSQSEIIATIVYSFFHIGCGWSLGIQELRLGKDGQQLGSRLATTVDSQYGVRPSQALQSGKRHSAAEPEHIQSTPSAPFILHQQPPTSMSYSHPYLLTSHADNTLTMYLVVSTADNLFVQGGRRLWGHTSSVSAVQVTKRGKAVSVSSRGDEIRIWELETAISSLGTRKAPKEEHGIPLSTGSRHEPEPALPRTLSESLNSTDRETSPLSKMQDCVGFDEERVLLLRERGVGTQLLECYDFT